MRSNKTSDLKLTELLSSQHFKHYSWISWILILIFAYVVGLIISSFTFYLKEKFNRWFGYSFRFAELLKEQKNLISKKSKGGVTESIREKIVKEIIDYFNLKNDFDDWNQYIESNSNSLLSLTINYIKEKSILINPFERRFLEKLTFARNFIFSFVFIVLNLLWMLRGDAFGTKIGLIASLLIIAVLGYIFYKMQIQWYMEDVLLKFYCLRRMEIEGSKLIQENSVLR